MVAKYKTAMALQRERAEQGNFGPNEGLDFNAADIYALARTYGLSSSEAVHAIGKLFPPVIPESFRDKTQLRSPGLTEYYEGPFNVIEKYVSGFDVNERERLTRELVDLVKQIPPPMQRQLDYYDQFIPKDDPHAAPVPNQYKTGVANVDPTVLMGTGSPQIDGSLGRFSVKVSPYLLGAGITGLGAIGLGISTGGADGEAERQALAYEQAKQMQAMMNYEQYIGVDGEY